MGVPDFQAPSATVKLQRATETIVARRQTTPTFFVQKLFAEAIEFFVVVGKPLCEPVFVRKGDAESDLGRLAIAGGSWIGRETLREIVGPDGSGVRSAAEIGQDHLTARLVATAQGFQGVIVDEPILSLWGNGEPAQTSQVREIRHEFAYLFVRRGEVKDRRAENQVHQDHGKLGRTLGLGNLRQDRPTPSLVRKGRAQERASHFGHVGLSEGTEGLGRGESLFGHLGM